MELKYNHVLLKLSGRAVANDQGDFAFAKIDALAEELKFLLTKGLSLAIVIGGGNIIRGRSIKNNELAVTTADYMGMLATNINSLALSGVFTKHGIDNIVLSVWPMSGILTKYSGYKLRRNLKKGHIVICAGGTGMTGCSTDTAAILRAKEMSAQVVLKATDVGGVYDKDPDQYKDAIMYDELTYQQALKQDLRVMDKQAFVKAQKNKQLIIVYKLANNNLTKALAGEKIGTIIKNQ